MMLRLRKISAILALMGISPLRLVNSVRGVPAYCLHLATAWYQGFGGWSVRIFPVFADRYEESGIAGGHYFHMDLWAARIIQALSPSRLVDVGSRIDGFVSHVLVFRNVEVFDLRPLRSSVPGLTFRQVDVTNAKSIPQSYGDCVTCLHALEHFGLGRYGDTVDMGAWKAGIANLARILRPGGMLLLGVPVGRERLEFNAHRVFQPHKIIEEATRNGLHLKSFAYVDDNGAFHDPGVVESCTHLRYGCGCFQFVKVQFY